MTKFKLRLRMEALKRYYIKLQINNLMSSLRGNITEDQANQANENLYNEFIKEYRNVKRKRDSIKSGEINHSYNREGGL